MILGNPILIGGGSGGGLSDSDAVLVVTAPSGSTIMAEKSGVAITPTIWASASDPAFDCAIFSINPSLFDSVTPWTVTATLGTDTVSDTVVIDSNKEYGIRLEYSLYIIRDGTVNPDIVHTFSSAKGSLTDGAAYATYCSGEGSGSNEGYVMFTIPDVSKYSTLVMELYEARGWGGTGRRPQFGIYGTTPNSTSNPTNALAYVQIYGPQASDSGYRVSERDFTLDISSYAGPKYIVIQNAAAYTTILNDNHWYIKNFYLALGVTS